MTSIDDHFGEKVFLGILSSNANSITTAFPCLSLHIFVSFSPSFHVINDLLDDDVCVEKLGRNLLGIVFGPKYVQAGFVVGEYIIVTVRMTAAVWLLLARG